MKSNLDIELEILRLANDANPDIVDDETIGKWRQSIGDKSLHAAMKYLHDHRLIEDGTSMSADGIPSFWGFGITSRGRDFLLENGGLSAALGVITIKIHEDSLRSLLLAKLSAAPLDETEEQSSALAATIRNLPAQAIQTLADKLIELGVGHLPTGAHQLHTWIVQALSR